MTHSKLLNTLLLTATATMAFSASADDAGQTNHLMSNGPAKMVNCEIVSWNADGSGSAPSIVAHETPESQADGSVETTNWSADGSGSVYLTISQCRRQNGRVILK